MSAIGNPRYGAVVTAQYNLDKTIVPTGLPSSGVVGNNGALTLNTALPDVYDNGLYLYFPANALYVGSPAGSYWTVMSSVTAGTVYANTINGETDKSVVPATLVPIVATGPGAYTQISTSVALGTLVVPANSTDDGDRLFITQNVRWASSTSTKTAFFRVNTVDGFCYGSTSSLSVTGANLGAYLSRVGNKLLIRRKISTCYGSDYTTTVSYIATDFTAPQLIAVAASIANAADFVICNEFRIEVQP